MSELDPRLSKALTTHALVVAGLSVAHSLRVRGLHRTLLFAALGSAVPVSGEYLAVNVLKVLHHHVRPQVEGIPLAIALAWYNIVYGAFTAMESVLNATDSGEGNQSRALAPATAAAATGLDLLLDPAGLDLGLWQWSGDGTYAAKVEGPNGKRGVPLLNFAGWMVLATGVVLAYQRLDPSADSTGATHAGVAGGSKAGRGAALLLMSYYLPAAAWGLKRRRHNRLLYSAPFAATMWAALKRRSGNSPRLSKRVKRSRT